jgi:hypothetical protein
MAKAKNREEEKLFVETMRDFHRWRLGVLEKALTVDEWWWWAFQKGRKEYWDDFPTGSIRRRT